MRRFRSLLSALVDALDRLFPSVLTAAGITLVAAGMLTYLSPAAAAPEPSATVPITTPSTSGTRPSLPPPPSGSETFTGVVTRVVVPAMNIDLAVIPSPAHEEFPFCNVAEYFVVRSGDGTVQRQLAYPGQPQSTYLYAHARNGMFGALLKASMTNNGKAMNGMYVEVYTSDDKLFLYQIAQVRRHVPFETTLNDPLAATTDLLWLQTSETTYQGPSDHSTKLLLLAQPLAHFAADHAQAHPANTAVVCRDAPPCQQSNGVGCRK